MSKTIKSQAQIFKEEAGYKKTGGADAFYKAPDDVTRNIARKTGGGADAFYSAPDDVTRNAAGSSGFRGVCLPSVDKGGFDQGGYKDVRPDAELKGPVGWFADPDDAYAPGGTDDKAAAPPVQQDFSNQPPFELKHIPPPKPGDSYFKFEVTTQFVDSVEPHAVGNFLLDFYNTKVSATYLKNVKHHKYAIKTDVFVDTMMCTMKTRIYKLGETRYAVEFQRRNGDTIAFNGTYQKACQYLRKRAEECTKPGVLTMEKWEEPPSIFSFEPLDIPDGEEIQITKEEMIPLLDVTSLKGAPGLQAEAATSLSKMAEEKNVILYDDRVFQSVHELVQVDSTDVAHPTSCLVWHLAQQDKAQQFFASSEIPNFPKQILLMTILWKILLDVTHPQVKAKLAQALNLSLEKQKNLGQGECYLRVEDAQTMYEEMSMAMRTKEASVEVMKEIGQAHLSLRTISSFGDKPEKTA